MTVIQSWLSQENHASRSVIFCNFLTLKLFKLKHLIRISRAFDSITGGVSSSLRMGQANVWPSSRVEKIDINPDYVTYGREGDNDYAVDFNHSVYQPSDYDEMYYTSSDRSKKVRH